MYDNRYNDTLPVQQWLDETYRRVLPKILVDLIIRRMFHVNDVQQRDDLLFELEGTIGSVVLPRLFSYDSGDEPMEFWQGIETYLKGMEDNYDY